MAILPNDFKKDESGTDGDPFEIIYFKFCKHYMNISVKNLRKVHICGFM